MSEKWFALKVTIPILLGYLAIGCAFGLIVGSSGYPWFIVLIMSLLIFAGAAQYAAVGMFAAGAGYLEIAVAAFLINSRHIVYGVSLLRPFQDCMPYTPYLIFGLTDETYGVLTTTQIPEHFSKAKTYFYITFFNQLYWVVGGLIGFFLGTVIPFDFTGVGFALPALFTVLLVEQWKNCREKIPFLIAAVCALAAVLIVGPKHMLILSFILSITALIFMRKMVYA